MKRRKFIKLAGALGAMPMMNLACSQTEQSKYKLGYQLYSIRDEMDKKPIETLKKLKAMGYQDFEHFGFDGEKGEYYGIKTSEFKKMLDDMELTITSGHYPIDPTLEKSDEEIKRYIDQCIEGALQLNSKYITWPWLDPAKRTMDNYKLMCRKLNLIGEQISKTELGFAYHNHGFEFEDHNGEHGYEVIIKETDPGLVKLQVDMYWVMHSSNTNPKELVDAQPGRYVMWHIKDMDKVTRDYTELGNGSINYLEILPDPIKSGLDFYYIEQGGNYAVNSTVSAAESAKYFKANLAKFL